MTLIRRATFAVPNTAKLAAAVLFQVIAKLHTVKMTFIVNKNKGKSFDQRLCYYGVCVNEDSK